MVHKQSLSFSLIISFIVLLGVGCSPQILPLQNKVYETDLYERETIVFSGDSIFYTIFCPIGECEKVYKGKYEGKRKVNLYTNKEPEGSFLDMFEEEIKEKIRVKSLREIYLGKARFGLWTRFDQLLYEKSLNQAAKLIRRYKGSGDFYDEASYQRFQIDTVTFLDHFVSSSFEKMGEKNLYYAVILQRLIGTVDSSFTLAENWYDPEFQAVANDTFDAPIGFSEPKNLLRFSGKTHYENAMMYAPPKDFGYLLQASALFDLHEDSYAMVIKVSKLDNGHQLAFTFQYNKKTLKLEGYGVIGLRVCP